MVLFNLIFRLLSNVILVIRNGCLPKFGHLQSTVNKLLENSAPTLIWKLRWKGGRVGSWEEGGVVCSHMSTYTLIWEAAAREMTRHLQAIWWHHAFRWPTEFTLLYIWALCSKTETGTHPSAGPLPLNPSSQIVIALPKCRMMLFL